MWTKHEKNVFLTLLQVSGGVIENKKKLNSDVFKWDCIQQKFVELTGRKVTIEELKNKWEEIKLSTKCNLQLGNVSSSEYIKVLAICLGLFNEDVDLHEIKTELQIEFQPPNVNFEWDKKLLTREAFSGKSCGKKKRKAEETNKSQLKNMKKAGFDEEEFRLKKLNLERELEHQAVRHKMEVEILDLKKKVMLKRLALLNRKILS